MNQDIKRLICLTTIVRVFDNTSHAVIYGDESFVDRFNQTHLHGYQGKQHHQADLSDLEKYWENKWQSFGHTWSEERQNYRFLYDSFKLFYYSFEQLRFNKVDSINAHGNKKKILYFNNKSGLHLCGVYHHGKKCIDLLKTLKLIDLKHQDCKFLSEFSETRNKLIEHNYNPHDYENKQPLNLQIEPFLWSLINTNSLLDVAVHESNQERAFDVYVDYYEDYFKLEGTVADIIKTF